MDTKSNYVAPSLFVNHGGGPLPLLGDEDHADLVKHLKHIVTTFNKPKAIVVISAHYEEKELTILHNVNSEMLYDYGGFPPETYKYKYNAPSSEELVNKLKDILIANKLPTPKIDTQRGFDHGIFVPLMIMYPAADIPVVAVSLVCDKNWFDPAFHFRLGQAIGALREDGVLILGSGFTFHNMRGFQSSSFDKSKQFDDYLKDSLTNKSYSISDRESLISNWKNAPHSLFVHPREEHLIPLFVVVGAGLNDLKD